MSETLIEPKVVAIHRKSLLSRLDTAPNLEQTKTKGEGFMQIRGKPCLWMGITERVILGREDNSRTDRAKFWQTRQLTGGCFSILMLCSNASHAAKRGRVWMDVLRRLEAGGTLWVRLVGL